MGENVLKYVAHSKRVLDIATSFGWLCGARYTNCRDVREYQDVGFIDIDWKNYCFEKHLSAVKKIKPHMTVARDIDDFRDFDHIMGQAYQLLEYCDRVVIVPKDLKMRKIFNKVIPDEFVLGFSVPTKYGGTDIEPELFKRPVHLLGGRPDVQYELAKKMDVVSLDCNRFTLDARFGDYFDGKKFVRHPIGGYDRCVRDSILNINAMWSGSEL